MIKKYSIQKPFDFRRASYRNLQQFKDQLTEVEKHSNPYYRILIDSRRNLFLEQDQLYPCFDSSDRMYENRYYHYLFYCKDREELELKFRYLNEIYNLGTGAQNDARLIPNIFYGDDTLFFEIAE